MQTDTQVIQLRKDTRAVNNFTGSTYTRQQIEQDESIRQKVTEPSKENLEQEAKDGITLLKNLGVDETLAKQHADQYIQLRKNRNRSEQEERELQEIAHINDAGKNLTGFSKIQFPQAFELYREWDRRVESAKGIQKDRAVQMKDMFYALATTQNVNTEVIQKLVDSGRVNEQQEEALRRMITPDLNRAQEMALTGKHSRADIEKELDVQRQKKAQKLAEDGAMVALVSSFGGSARDFTQTVDMNRLQEITVKRYIKEGDYERAKRQNEIAHEAKNPQEFRDRTIGLAKESRYFSATELGSLVSLASLFGMDSGGVEEFSSEAVATNMFNYAVDIEQLRIDEQQEADDMKKQSEDFREGEEETEPETGNPEQETDKKEGLYGSTDKEGEYSVGVLMTPAKIRELTEARNRNINYKLTKNEKDTSFAWMNNPSLKQTFDDNLPSVFSRFMDQTEIYVADVIAAEKAIELVKNPTDENNEKLKTLLKRPVIRAVYLNAVYEAEKRVLETATKMEAE